MKATFPFLGNAGVSADIVNTQKKLWKVLYFSSENEIGKLSLKGHGDLVRW
jgi:hypothetical protein